MRKQAQTKDTSQYKSPSGKVCFSETICVSLAVSVKIKFELLSNKCLDKVLSYAHFLSMSLPLAHFSAMIVNTFVTLSKVKTQKIDKGIRSDAEVHLLSI